MMHLLIFLKKWARLYDPSNLEVFLAKMLPAGTVRAKSSTRPAYCAFSLVPDREIEGIRVWEICQTYVNVLKKVN